MSNWFTPEFARKSAPKPEPEQPFKPKLRYDLFVVEDQRPDESTECARAITYNGVDVGRMFEGFLSGKHASSIPYDKEVNDEIQHWFAQYILVEDEAEEIRRSERRAKEAEEHEISRLKMRAAIGIDTND
jgi:hypothetical protein